jgi:radical SAM protein with 4Fe4S-binding SPASM domain
MGNRIDLKLGYSCNNNCIFCAQAHKKELGDKSTGRLKREIEKEASCYDEVVFTGGEPTIRADLTSLVAFAKEKGYKLIQIQSNGRRFSDRRFCMDIIEAGANSFSIAIHGHNEELHNRLTCSKSFDETKQGIKNLIELGQRVALNTVIVKQNYEYLPEIARLVSLLKPDQAQFAFVHAIGNASKNFEEVVPQMKDVVPFLKSAVDVLIDNNIEPRIEAIPPCILHGYEQYITERFLDTTKIVDIDEEVENWQDIMKKLAKSTTLQCFDCKYNLTCEGTWKEYIERIGGVEFKAVYPKMNELIVQVTNMCNLNCDFCFDSTKDQGKKELSKQLIHKVLDEVKGETKAIRFTGGEPLLRDDLVEILSYAKEKGFYVILNTNGVLLDKENLGILGSVDDVLLSFHDISQKKEKERLFRLIKERYPRITLRCCTTLVKANIDKMEEFYDFMQFQPVDDWFLLRQVPNKLNPEPINRGEARKMVGSILELNEKFGKKIKIANGIPFCVGDKEKVASICVGGRNDSGHTRLYVGCDGTILPSYSSYEPIGRIQEDKVSKIWLGKRIKDIRNLKYLSGLCSDCYYKQTCKGGISCLDYRDHLID